MNDDKQTDSLQKRIVDIVSNKRANSQEKEDTERENVISLTQRTNYTFLLRKKNVGGSGSNWSLPVERNIRIPKEPRSL